MVDGAVEASICPCRFGTPTDGAGDFGFEDGVASSSWTTDLVDLSSGNLDDAFRLREPKDDADAWRSRRLSDEPTDLIVPTRDLKVLLLATRLRCFNQYSTDNSRWTGSPT